MNILKIIQEAKVHPMAVHAYSVGGGNYKVHAVGSKVEHVKAGETIRSSDLDDLTDAGHKVKEINKPMSEARNYPKSPTGMGHSSDAHFNQQSQKMQDAINMHLRKGKDYPEAVKAAKVHVKEAEEIVDVSEGLGDRYTNDPIGNFSGLKAHAKKLGSKHKDYDDLMVAASHMAFGNKDHLNKHIEKLDTDVRDKVKEYMKEEAAISEAHTLSHSSYPVAINTALSHHKDLTVSSEDRGITSSLKRLQNVMQKPAEGETVKHAIPATDKAGNKHMIHIHVHNKGGDKPFETKTHSSKVSNKKMAEEADQIDELKHSGGVLDNYLSKTNPDRNTPEENKKRAAGRGLALGKKWGKALGPYFTKITLGSNQPKVSATNEEADQIEENFGGQFKDSSEWENAAKKRGLVVKLSTHPSGEVIKYQIAKDKSGNNRGHFDHGTKSGRLTEEADLKKIDTKTLQDLTQLHKYYGQKDPRAKASAERGEAELKRREDAKKKTERVSEALGTIKNMKAASKFNSNNVSDMLRGEKARKAGMAKVSTTKDIGYRVVDVGPGQKETVRKMHNFKEESESVDEAESGLSTKTLANYSIKASDAAKHRKLPTSKVDNRYAGVSRVDRILSLRDKKKVD